MNINILEFLEKTVLHYPDKIAVKHNEDGISFTELRNKALYIGEVLEEYNFKNEPIAVFMPKSINAITALLGVIYSGNIFFSLDVDSPRERNKSILSKIQPKIILTNNKLFEEAKAYESNDIVILNIEEFDYSLQNQLKVFIPQNIDTDPLYIVNTSGSTGHPKGVLISHGAMISFLNASNRVVQTGPDDVIGNQAPFTFDIAISDMFIAFMTGATLLLIDRINFSFPIKLIQILNENRVTYIRWVASALVIVSNAKLIDKINSGLKYVMISGEKIPQNHLQNWLNNSTADFFNCYGPTECTAYSVVYKFQRDDELDKSMPIGRSLYNKAVFLLNEKNSLITKSNVIGEICIKGSCVSLGYWNDREKTEEVFIQNPLQNNYREIIYKTGDLAYYNEEGDLVFQSRKDYQIKHMGYRIELTEIEAAVNADELIENCCVVYNDDKQEIRLFYSGKIDISDLLSKLKAKIPAYMIPAKVKKLDKMPVNQNGKLDRKQLSEV